MFDASIIKDILPTLVLDVVVPTADQVSDLSLIVKWYSEDHPKYATAMLIPFLLNVCSNFYHWWKWDSCLEKRFTWLLVLFQLWPVYRAVKLVIHLYRRIESAEAEKRRFESEITSLEAYLEAAPSVFVMFVAFATTHFDIENEKGLIGESLFLFRTTFLMSLLTSSLGVTKYLLIGPCRIIPNNGLLNGMLTWKFFLTFFTVLFSFASKIFTHAPYFAWIVGPKFLNLSYILSFSIAITVSTLPQLTMAIALIWHGSEFINDFFKTILHHPQLLFLPVLTYFTIGPRKMSCLIKPPRRKTTQLALSPQFTICNMVVTTATNLGFYVVNQTFGFGIGSKLFGVLENEIDGFWEFFWLALSAHIIGIFLTIGFFSNCPCYSCEWEIHHIELSNRMRNDQVSAITIINKIDSNPEEKNIFTFNSKTTKIKEFQESNASLSENYYHTLNNPFYRS